MKRFQQTRHALGSTAILTLRLNDATVAKAIFTDLWQYIDEFEQRFSRFLPDSELTDFNDRAGGEVWVSDAFRDLLVAAKQFAHITNGLYNPFILPGLQSAGYVGSWPLLAQGDSKDYSQRAAIVSADRISINANTAKIPVNTALDFGGIGKGYLLDELAALLEQHDVADYWLSLGGDIICKGKDLDAKPWQVAIESAQTPGKMVAQLRASQPYPAIATSGITKRKGNKDGQAWHHIIDPRTGKPAQTDVMAASITAKTGVDADVLAKCVVIVGSKQAKAFAAKHNIGDMVLQTVDGKVAQ